jgi:hypothetical protein
MLQSNHVSSRTCTRIPPLAEESPMNESKATDAIDQDRRQLVGTAAMGFAVAGATSLLPALLHSADDADIP